VSEPWAEVGSNQSGGIRLNLSKMAVVGQPFGQPLGCCDSGDCRWSFSVLAISVGILPQERCYSCERDALWVWLPVLARLGCGVLRLDGCQSMSDKSSFIRH